MAAVLLSVGEGSSKASSSSNPDQILFYGIVPVLVASVLSGLASALCQWASQASKRYGEAIKQHGFFYGWTALTLVNQLCQYAIFFLVLYARELVKLIPVVLNAVGGILVGLVTSYAGGGFVIVSALLVTALLQLIFDGKPPSPYCLVALPLVMISISIYQKYPYRVKKKQV
ncbi:CMP-sialic acid transporter 5 [Capsicum annuum]|nr:CMP-sialic acid transporter 5 [Capsicum annuum]KAF3640855.1 CMP-sialic acid transporter 5 [Capsicum annuum]